MACRRLLLLPALREPVLPASAIVAVRLAPGILALGARGAGAAVREPLAIRERESGQVHGRWRRLGVARHRRRTRRRLFLHRCARRDERHREQRGEEAWHETAGADRRRAGARYARAALAELKF